MDGGQTRRGRGRRRVAANDDAREREWVNRAADDLVAERSPGVPPETARERAMSRIMVALRAGRKDIPPPSADLARRVEAVLAKARGAPSAGHERPATSESGTAATAADGAAGDQAETRTEPASDKNGVTRREVLRWAGAAAVVATLASTGVDRVLGLLANRKSSAEASGWRPVAASADISDGEVIFREVDGHSLFLIRDAGRVRALSAVCTHMPCVLRLDASAHEFRCPCHGAAFDLDGRSIASAYRAPLPSLPGIATREVGGRVYVWVG